MSPSPSPSTSPRGWSTALPDLVAFLVGLAVVWVRGWSTTDLIWSLWLSSLVVGYALIVWALVQPTLELLGLGWQHRAEVEASPTWNDPKQLALFLAIALFGAAFYLVFFTAHFGGFHFIQSQFLLSSYPLGFEYHTMNRATLMEVVRRYWPALPSAFLARRYAFTRRVFGGPGRRDVRRGQTWGQIPQVPDRLAHQEPAATRSKWDEMAESRVGGPYLQVMRMHVVIIAFGALHAAQRDSFAAFAAIYALYFFPWRLLRRTTETAATTLSVSP
jgi:Family of unknown function (DUF6498)